MSIEELEKHPKEYLTPAQVAGILGCDPQTIRVWAKQCPDGLGFPVILLGNRVKIPKQPFLKYMTGKG